MRDKDYITTPEGLVFEVMGYEHPKGAFMAVLKHRPLYKSHEKLSHGTQAKYRESVEYLKKTHPQYVFRHRGLEISAVPFDNIARILKPKQRALEIVSDPEDALEEKTSEFLRELSSLAGISILDLGVTGSLLWDGHREDSDMDVVVYGKENVLKSLLALDKMADITHRKNVGIFRGTRFSLRGVRKQKPEKMDFEPKGIVRTKATIIDNTESLFFPITYRIKSHIADELVSFITDYEHIFGNGTHLDIRGSLEHCGEKKRIVIGSYEGEDNEFAVPV